MAASIGKSGRMWFIILMNEDKIGIKTRSTVFVSEVMKEIDVWM